MDVERDVELTFGHHVQKVLGFFGNIGRAKNLALPFKGGDSMSKRLLMLVVTLFVSGCMVWASAKTISGTVSDEHCGAKHAEASDAAAACVAKCAAGGAKYVLVSGGKVYSVEPQDKFADFGGKAVKVTGTVKGMAITATSVEAAPAGGGKKNKG